jgi:multidrug efflux pump subunit AcrA (membrane-fusion protein)
MKHKLQLLMAASLFLGLMSGQVSAQKSEKIVKTVRLTGTVVDPDVTELKSQLTGQSVIKKLVEDGARVKKGEPLVEFNGIGLKELVNKQEILVQRTINSVGRMKSALETTELANGLHLKKAEAKYKIAGAKLEQYKKTGAGTALKKHQQLVALERTRISELGEIIKLNPDGNVLAKIEQAKARIALVDAKGKLQLAQENLQEFKEFGSGQQLAFLALAVDEAKSNLDTVKVNNKSKLRDAMDSITTSEKILALEKERLADNRNEIENLIILAPYDGVISYYRARDWERREPIEKGARIMRGQKIFGISPKTRRKVDLTIPQSMRALLKKGQKAVVRVEGYPKQEIVGELSFVSGTLDPNLRGQTQKSYFKGEVTVVNPPDNLFTGVSVTVEIIVEDGSKRRIIPQRP